MSAQWESLEQAMRSERLRMHGVIVVTSSAASAVLCLVVAGALWGHVAQTALMYWVAAVATAIALRLSVGLGHRRSGASRKPEATWLFRYRASFAVHGMAWGLRGPFMQALRADYFGLKAIGMIMGLSAVIIAVGQVAGPMIAGLMADLTGNYRSGFLVLALLAGSGSVLFLLARKPR